MTGGLFALLLIFIAIQLVPFTFLIQPTVLLLIYSIGKRVGLHRSPASDTPSSCAPGIPLTTVPGAPADKQFQFGILITAHKETDFIPPIIDSLLKQTYSRFNVYVVADDCDISELRFADPRIKILPTPTPFHDQISSLQFGFSHLQPTDEVLVIFDPDNLVHPDFCLKMNGWYNKGFLAVQGNLLAKNKTGKYSQIDNMGVAFNNFVGREMQSALGLSSNIWGCGVSVHRDIYQRIVYDSKSASGGFDKHMQVEIARNVDRIAYAWDAILYDEKVDDGSNFERQRIRWIAAYFKFLGKAFGLLFTGFRRWNFNLIYFGYNLIRLPYFLLLPLSILFMAADWWLLSPAFGEVWFIGLLLFSASFTIIVTRLAVDKSTPGSILYIPLIFYHQFRALFKIRIYRKTLLKTEHSRKVYINEILTDTHHV
jgi:cellulose synthase/poly-beta-1,6-N-acetylglucosamine synthase-like glycosyltransferase